MTMPSGLTWSLQNRTVLLLATLYLFPETYERRKHFNLFLNKLALMQINPFYDCLLDVRADHATHDIGCV